MKLTDFPKYACEAEKVLKDQDIIRSIKKNIELQKTAHGFNTSGIPFQDHFSIEIARLGYTAGPNRFIVHSDLLTKDLKWKVFCNCMYYK